jgi:hypothetical protein
MRTTLAIEDQLLADLKRLAQTSVFILPARDRDRNEPQEVR